MFVSKETRLVFSENISFTKIFACTIKAMRDTHNNGDDEVLVTDVVLTETIWVLKGKRYALNKEKIIDVLHALFAESNIKFEDDQAVWCALKDFANATPIKIKGKTKQADFPDALIVNKAKRYAQLKNKEISHIYTFDKAALEIEGTEAP